MSKYDLFLNIKYDINKNEFKIETNVKEPLIEDTIANTIRAYMDKSFSSITKKHDNKVSMFEIGIKIDLSEDIFNLSTNGSESITLGILAHLLNLLGTDKVIINK